MSSRVGAGDGLPSFSCTFGLDGTRGSTGTGPRVDGTVMQTTVALSSSQSHGSPAAPFSRSVPLTTRAWPVAVSAIHNSMPVALVFVKARYLPFGENASPPALTPAGSP